MYRLGHVSPNKTSQRDMALWLLTLALSGILAAKVMKSVQAPVIHPSIILQSSHLKFQLPSNGPTNPTNPTVKQMQDFIKDNMNMANNLVPLYASTYARANLLVQLQYAEKQISGNEDEIITHKKMSEIGSEVKCAAAEIFLLLINRGKYSNANADWSHDIDCMRKYDFLNVMSFRGKEIVSEVKKEKITNVNADVQLIQIFDMIRGVGFYLNLSKSMIDMIKYDF